MASDTIFALSSGRPPAAIAIIRISGPAAHKAAAAMASELPAARRASVRHLHHPQTGELLDEALVLRFDGPESATGEDLVEFHCHGGRAVVDGVLGALEGLCGARVARPGEFTRRALENDRLDLIEAEGLADLLEAETESQRRAALLMAEGTLSRQIEAWRTRLLELSARAEAAIDYVEADSVDSDPGLQVDCAALADEIQEWLSRPRAEPLRDGLTVVIAGPPNTGKSSLLNRLSGLERAIVSDIPGTTRDHIEVSVSLDGVPLRLIDTAGLRDSEEAIEQIGILRSRQLIDGADIVVWLGSEADRPSRPHLIVVRAKCDLPSSEHAGAAGGRPISSKTGQGIDDLLAAIELEASHLLPVEGEVALNSRHAQYLGVAFAALQHSVNLADSAILAEQLRQARAAFDRISGRTGIEEVLDALFGRFCLGK